MVKFYLVTVYHSESEQKRAVFYDWVPAAPLKQDPSRASHTAIIRGPEMVRAPPQGRPPSLDRLAWHKDTVRPAVSLYQLYAAGPAAVAALPLRRRGLPRRRPGPTGTRPARDGLNCASAHVCATLDVCSLGRLLTSAHAPCGPAAGARAYARSPWARLAPGESVIEYKSPLSVLHDTHDHSGY
jgi:hypothetical protein